MLLYLKLSATNRSFFSSHCRKLTRHKSAYFWWKSASNRTDKGAGLVHKWLCDFKLLIQNIVRLLSLLKFLLYFFAFVQLFTHEESNSVKSSYKACADFASNKSKLKVLNPKRIVVPSPTPQLYCHRVLYCRNNTEIQSYNKEQKWAKAQFLISKAISHDCSWH